MAPTRKATTYLRVAMLGGALVLPLLSLVLLGGLWLWQGGYVLHWGLSACAVAVSAYWLEVWLVGTRAPEAEAPRRPDDRADRSWAPREEKAWAAVLRIADAVEPAHLASWEQSLALGLRTVEAAASEVHPGEKEPLWRFTVPEALALVERVAGQLRPFIVDNVPLGDRLTVGQVMRLYNWRVAIGLAEKAYDLWRIIRLFNPTAAVTQEMREHVSKKMFDWGRDQLAVRLARGYVLEVGRAAIDLYGGRLRVMPEELAVHVSAATRRDRMAARAVEPLRVLIGGQINAGKSSLVNALSDEIRAAVDVLPATPDFTAYELKRDGVPAALIVDSPGLGVGANPIGRLIEEAAACDLVLWVSSAVRPDRETDRMALEAFRRYFAERPHRRRPPIMLVLSHIDRLRPFQEWQPPYDVATAAGPKAASIRLAMEAVGGELGFALDQIVPACLDQGIGRYNVDAVWAKMVELLPEARNAQLVRCLSDITGGWDWRRLWTQAVNAGRVIARAAIDKPGSTRRPP